MRASEFVFNAQWILSHLTVYAYGQMGLPISNSIKMEPLPYKNMTAVRSGETTRSYASRYANARATAKTCADDTFGFDCSGLIQACLCDWQGTDDAFGGCDLSKLPTRYSANDYAHMTEWKGGCLTKADWDEIKPGAIMWQSKDGKTAYHIAIYIGNGKAIEAAYNWCGAIYGMEDGVQEIDLAGFENGYMRTNRNGCAGYRSWIAFGYLPMVEDDPIEEEPHIIVWNNEDCAEDEIIIPIEEYEELKKCKDIAYALRNLIDVLNE